MNEFIDRVTDAMSEFELGGGVPTSALSIIEHPKVREKPMLPFALPTAIEQNYHALRKGVNLEKIIHLFLMPVAKPAIALTICMEGFPWFISTFKFYLPNPDKEGFGEIEKIVPVRIKTPASASLNKLIGKAFKSMKFKEFMKDYKERQHAEAQMKMAVERFSKHHGNQFGLSRISTPNKGSQGARIRRR